MMVGKKLLFSVVEIGLIMARRLTLEGAEVLVWRNYGLCKWLKSNVRTCDYDIPLMCFKSYR